MKNAFTHSNRFGFTLTEMAIVLGVMSAVIGGVWTVATSVSESRKETEAATELQTIVQNLLSTEQGQALQKCSNSTNITSCMLTNGVIPFNYQDAATTTTADNPWSVYNTVYTSGGGGLYVWNMTNNPPAIPSTFRVSFYNIPSAGCVGLLLAATNCQYGQPGCPVQVGTSYNPSVDYCTPGQLPCPASGTPTSTPNTGWAIMTPTNAAALCAVNLYGASSTLPSSLEFDYKLE